MGVDLTNALFGMLGALIGSLGSFGAVLLDHRIRHRSEQKRTLNSVLRELGTARRILESWIELRRGDPSWRQGGPLGVRPSLQVPERLAVEVSELPTEIGRLLERVDRKLLTFYQHLQMEFEREGRRAGETPGPSEVASVGRVVQLAEFTVGEIRAAETACTKQWDAWQVPFYRRPLRRRGTPDNYQGPRRIPGYDSD